MACSKAVLTAKLGIKGRDSDVTGGLIFWTVGDPLLPEGCDEELTSSRVTHGCMLEIGTWNYSSGRIVVSTSKR